MLKFGKQQEDENLSGKSALVLGGSKGLGFLIARRFGRLGAHVTITARDESELAWAANELRDDAIAVETIASDVRDREATMTLVRDVEERRQGIDFLVNNAGVIQVGPLSSLTLDDFDQAVETMFWGVVAPSLAALPGMKARKSGRIVNITSIGGKVSVPHLLPYNSAKFGAVGFSEGLRAELAGTGVGVVTVVPGLMRTGSFVNAQYKGDQDIEFSMFTPLSSLPGISIPADDAARRIVRAALNNEAEVILSVPANLMVRAHGIAPGLTTQVMGLTARMLPKGNGATEAIEGSKLLPKMGRVQRSVSTLGTKALRRFQPPSVRGKAA